MKILNIRWREQDPAHDHLMGIAFQADLFIRFSASTSISISNSITINNNKSPKIFVDRKPNQLLHINSIEKRCFLGICICRICCPAQSLGDIISLSFCFLIRHQCLCGCHKRNISPSLLYTRWPSVTTQGRRQTPLFIRQQKCSLYLFRAAAWRVLFLAF